MKRITFKFHVMSQKGMMFPQAFNTANIHGRLTLISLTEPESENFIVSATISGTLIDCMNVVHYFGRVGVAGIVETVQDETTTTVLIQNPEQHA